jgi:allantoate deiminase
MKLRRDAAAAAAEMILAVEKRAHDTADLVATVGCFEIKPGVVNVIAGEADISIDVRSPSDGIRLAAIAAMREELADIAQRRGVGLTTEVTYDQHAAICDAQLVQVCDKAMRALGLRPFLLPSGAGHDGLAMISLCPIAMLFVRNRGGISHSPEESVEASDVGFAIRGLGEVLLQLSAAETGRVTSRHAKAS